jgi:hypothetical protein
MKNRVVFGLALLLVVPALVYAQANVAGKWTGEMQGRGGAQQPVTLELTVNGAAITGTLTQGQGQPVEIQNAKLEGDTLTFTAAGGGRGGRGGGGGGGGAPGGAPPAGAGGGAPGGGGGGGRGGFAFNYTAKISGSEMTVTREAPAPPDGAAPAGGGAGGGGGRGGGGPLTFTLKKG